MNKTKIILAVSLTLVVITTLAGTAYAKTIVDSESTVITSGRRDVTDGEGEGSTLGDAVDPKDLSDIVIVFARIINLLAGFAGATFILMLFITAIKYATSTGDPRGIEAAKQTGTMAVVGLLVILGFYVITTSLAEALGIEGLLESPTSALRDGIQNSVWWKE